MSIISLLKKITAITFIFLFFVLALPVQGQSLSDEITGQYQRSAEMAEVGKVDPRIAAAGIIQLLLTLVGSIFLILIVLSGYWLLTARGEEDKVEKANKTIHAAIIGLIITLAAYSITYFVGQSTQKAITPGAMKEQPDGLRWSDL